MQIQELILLGIALVIATFLLRNVVTRLRGMTTSNKGKLSLELHSVAAASGQRFTGRVSISTKRSLRGLLRVSLVGKENQRQNDAKRTRLVNVFQNDQVLEEAREFPAGFSQTYAFEIAVPTATEARRGDRLLKELTAVHDASAIGSILKMAANNSHWSQRRIHWSIESRFETEGMDLYRKIKVKVDLCD